MGLFGHLGRSEPTPTPPDDLRDLYAAAARSCGAWKELDPDELVERERGYVVHVESDQAFRRYLGDALSAGGVVLADMTPLAFYVQDGNLQMLEPVGTWSAIVYERERRKVGAQR